MVGALLVWGVCIFIVSAAGENALHVAAYTTIFAVGLIALVVSAMVVRVQLSGDEIIVKTLRTRSLPRETVDRVEVRSSFWGQRVTLICRDGSIRRLPIPWRSDPNWATMLRQVEEWVRS